ncbi:C6 zinc finger protein [Xylaria cf. heliscus]|nr:C6 zinc finger protein [Xylaria cf. heliscus]
MEPIDFNQSTSLPLLTLGSNNAEFDYAAYLQDEDLDYLGDAGSSGSASIMNEVASTSVSPPTSTVVKSNSNQKQRLERRGHTKSRRGCYNCKRRRIKCQETRPSCGHCIKTGLKCEYPLVPQITHQPQHQIPLFSLQDMRFFQHFLLSCSPHQPLGNESIWTHEVPCLSQNYEYLMHAILGLAASDLMIQDPSLVSFAMAHRLKAIKAIKRSLTDVPKTNTFDEGNALLATCYALTFQSVMLDDGLAEFMTFCRGIVIVAIQMYCKGAKFIFSNFLGDDHIGSLQPLLEIVPLVQKDWTDMAIASIASLEPLCKQDVEIEYHQLITNIANALYTSSFLAYQLLCKHYGWWMQIPHENFQNLINGENQVCLLLASHWIALKQIMATITGVEHKQRAQQSNRKDGDMDIGIVRWLKHINRHVDMDHQQYNQWPFWVEAQLDIDLGYFGKELH